MPTLEVNAHPKRAAESGDSRLFLCNALECVHLTCNDRQNPKPRLSQSPVSYQCGDINGALWSGQDSKQQGAGGPAISIQWQDHLPPTTAPHQDGRAQPGQLRLPLFRDGQLRTAAGNWYPGARKAPQHPRPSNRPQTARPPPHARTASLADAALDHHRPPSLHQDQPVDAPLRAAGRPPRKELQPGHARRVHDHRQRAVGQRLHQRAARDEPAQLRRLRGGHRRGGVRRGRVPCEGDGA